MQPEQFNRIENYTAVDPLARRYKLRPIVQRVVAVDREKLLWARTSK